MSKDNFSYSGPVCLLDIEIEAKKRLCQSSLVYVEGGADEEITLRENKDAFTRLKLRPRMLCGVSEVDMSTTILGQTITMPICVAPTAYQKLAHPDGELATARASAKSQTCMILSTLSTSSLEDVSQAAPSGLRWFQFNCLTDKELTKQLICRAEHAGYKALVLTVDVAIGGKRRSLTRTGFQVPPHLSAVHLGDHDIFPRRCFPPSMFDKTTTWDIISWIKSVTKLPVVIKGILTAEDARLAVQHGADAIIVSNHGGRQLDGVLPTIEALPEVVGAVNGQIEVYMDGGVRLGTDVLKALALGARAVLVGRPVIWGLAYQGEEGVHKVLEMLRDELRTAMILSGCSTLTEISPSLVTSPFKCKCHL